MNEFQNKLLNRLLEINDKLSVHIARTWIELLWEDFEATYAKAGKKYHGEEMTAKVVSQWIENHGETLHEFIANNPKYKHLLDEDKSKMN